MLTAVSCRMDQIRSLESNRWSKTQNFGSEAKYEFSMHIEFLKTINWKTLVVSLLSVLSTLLCYYYKIEWEIRNDIVSFAVIIPIVFSINASFRRREEALKELAFIKGNAFAIRLAFSHWMADQPTDKELVYRVDHLLIDLFNDIKLYLTGKTVDDNILLRINEILRDVSLCTNDDMRKRFKIAPPELARINEYIRVICTNFQDLKNIRLYRTPISLRAYTKFFLAVFPILYSGTFSDIAREVGQVWVGISLALLYSVILTGLDNIQEGLENPFDGIGADDIQFDPGVHLFVSMQSTPADNQTYPGEIPTHPQDDAIELADKSSEVASIS